MDVESEVRAYHLATLVSILNRVIDDAVMHALTHDFGDIRRSHGVVFEMIDAEGTHVAELARRARMTRQAMGELVEDLERLGYVARRADPADRRAKLVFLTDAGEAATRQGISALDELEAQWTAHLGPANAAALRAALATLVASFGAAHVR